MTEIIDATYGAGAHALSKVTARVEDNPWTAIPLLGLDASKQLGRGAVRAGKFGVHMAVGLADTAAQRAGLVSHHTRLDPHNPADLLEYDEASLTVLSLEEDESGRNKALDLLENPDELPRYYITWRSAARKKDVAEGHSPKADFVLARDFRQMILERIGDNIRSRRTVERGLRWLRERGFIETDMNPQVFPTLGHTAPTTVKPPESDEI